MGNDLVSSCVLCAGLLLGLDLAPPRGTTAELSAAYSTLQRRHEIGPGERRDDFSDTTPKFLVVGLGRARAPREGMGAGTPAREWRVRLALGPSHDEQRQRLDPGILPVASSGTGRYENLFLLYRYPLSERDSLEGAWNRRTHKATDLVNLGGERHTFDERRNVSVERSDLAVGWRRRAGRLELAASARRASLAADNATAGAFHATRGSLWGGGVEVRAVLARWTLSAAGELAAGDLDVHEESAPAFEDRDFQARGRLWSARLSVARAFGRTELLLAATADRERLPFSAFAVLGEETVAFDAGFHPESRVSDVFWDLHVRRELRPGLRARLSLRATFGSETLLLSDSSGVRPDRRLAIDRGGDVGKGHGSLGSLGSPGFTIAVGCEVSIR